MPTPPQLTAVIRLLSPALKATGWTRFGGTFNRESEPGLVHAINFQSSRYGGKFTTNLGVYVREIDFYFDDWWGRQGKSGEPGRDGVVREEVCWLRTRLGRLGSTDEDLWWSYDEDAPTLAEDIRVRLEHQASRAFHEATSRRAILDAYVVGRGLPSWRRMEARTPLGYAVLLSGAGRSAEATQVIEEVLLKASGKPFAAVASVLGERLGLSN